MFSTLFNFKFTARDVMSQYALRERRYILHTGVFLVFNFEFPARDYVRCIIPHCCLIMVWALARHNGDSRPDMKPSFVCPQSCSGKEWRPRKIAQYRNIVVRSATAWFQAPLNTKRSQRPKLGRRVTTSTVPQFGTASWQVRIRWLIVMVTCHRQYCI